MNKSLSHLTEKALDAFWESVAAEFPEVKTGDLSPITTIRLDEIAAAAIAEWVALNAE